MQRPSKLQALVLLGLVLTAVSCATYTGVREARTAEESGDWDTAVLHYLELTQREPGNLSYRTSLLRAQMRASQMHLELGRQFSDVAELDAALIEFQKAVQLDPGNQLAQLELDKVREQILARDDGERAESLEEMKRRVARERSQPPLLKPDDEEPIDLNFPQPQDVKVIYRALCSAAGINVLFDPDLRDVQVPIELVGMPFQQALELVMRAAGHFYKVLSDDTIFIAEDNQQNRRKYEDQMIQSFFLSNGEPEVAMNVLRGLVGARNLVSNEDLNAIVMKDTADRVRVAQQIIDTFDKARGEVVVDIELLEVNTSDLQDLGVSLSAYQVTQSLNAEGSQLPLSEIEFLNQSDWLLTLPSVIYNFVKQSTNAEILAQPRLRISDGESAELTIGEQVPVPVTSFNSSNTIGGNIVPLTSFQYRDVGINITVEPRIHHNNEVSLVAGIEVSSITGFAPATGGVSQPLIGTRRIESTIRLKNGETNFLAGLLRTDDNITNNGIPGLAEIPVLGRLFSKKRNEKDRTDLVLTITPHIVRMPDITADDVAPIWVGTEENFSFRGGSPRIESEERGPFDSQEASELQERLRRQLENLPRDLQGSEQEDESGAQNPDTSIVNPSGPSGLGNDDQQDAQLRLPGSSPLPSGFEWVETVERLTRVSPRSAQTSGASAPVSVQLEQAEAVAGSRADLRVAVLLTTRMDVAHLPMVIDYDASRLSFIEFVPTDFLGAESETTVLAHERPIGRVTIGMSRLGGSGGVVGGGVVGFLEFRAAGRGEAHIAVRQASAMGPTLTRYQDVELGEVTVQVRGGSLLRRRPPRGGEESDSGEKKTPGPVVVPRTRVPDQP